MANVFADIGRSNIAAVGQDLLDRAAGVRAQETEMARQNLGTAIDIERFKQEQTLNQQEIEKGQFQLDAAKQEQEFQNYKIPVASL